MQLTSSSFCKINDSFLFPLNRGSLCDWMWVYLIQSHFCHSISNCVNTTTFTSTYFAHGIFRAACFGSNFYTIYVCAREPRSLTWIIQRLCASAKFVEVHHFHEAANKVCRAYSLTPIFNGAGCSANSIIHQAAKYNMSTLGYFPTLENNK